MNLMTKKICALLLAAVMLVGVVPAFGTAVYAEDAAETTETETAEKAEETTEEAKE